MSRYNTINFEKHKIVVIIDNNNFIWFNAKQICISLEYKDTKKIISNNVEKSDKIQLKNMNISFEMQQQPDSIYINETISTASTTMLVSAPGDFANTTTGHVYAYGVTRSNYFKSTKAEVIYALALNLLSTD